MQLARPTSKSVPIILSMLKKTPISLGMKAAGPDMFQVTVVASPAGTMVKVAMLWPSKGRMKSSLMPTLAGAVSRTSMGPDPALLLPPHS